jgi:hypothetical protein
MKRKIVGILVVALFFGTAFLPSSAAVNKSDLSVEKKIVESNYNDGTLIAPKLAFLFGRVNNKHQSDPDVLCNAVNLLVIMFLPPEIHWYRNSEVVSMPDGMKFGIFTNYFICGFFWIWE